MLRVRLFGGLALESEGVALPMPERRRACSLLGWLALHPGMHAQLLPRDGLCIVGGRGVYFRGAVARYLGLLAATLGRREDAVRHLEHALETNTRVQAPPWIARSRLDLARALLARGRLRDKHRAIDMLRRAELQAQELGMQSLAEQVTIVWNG